MRTLTLLNSAGRALFCAALIACGCVPSANATVRHHHRSPKAPTVTHSKVTAPPASLKTAIQLLVKRAPGHASVVIVDLNDGSETDIKPTDVVPAASTIKIPVMIEVFHQIKSGTLTETASVCLTDADRDFGWGQIAYAATGTCYTVDYLLSRMIDFSDNTATNMLIRSVGLNSINAEMSAIGCPGTQLPSDVRTANHNDIVKLTTSAADLAHMLSLMAQGQLIDFDSSVKMLNILKAQTENKLIPAVLPADIPVAHKTGTLSDTLNDGGIVYAKSHAYIIVVLTTHDSSLRQAKLFIHAVSQAVYDHQKRLAPDASPAIPLQPPPPPPATTAAPPTPTPTPTGTTPVTGTPVQANPPTSGQPAQAPVPPAQTTPPVTGTSPVPKQPTDQPQAPPLAPGPTPVKPKRLKP